MRVHSSMRYATLATLVAALACAGNKAETDQAAAAKDTTTTVGRDTGQTGTPTGQTPSDTFLQNQGTGTPQDTAGYSGMERDTTGQAGQAQTDTTGMTGGQDTSGMTGADTSSASDQSSGQSSTDSTGMSTTGDTTGYDQSQSRDSTNR